MGLEDEKRGTRHGTGQYSEDGFLLMSICKLENLLRLYFMVYAYILQF